MRIPVNTLWMGKVAVRARFIHDCKISGEMLVIEHDGRTMSIPAKELDDRAAGSSVKPIKEIIDKRRGKDYLIYFVWKPDPMYQRPLL